MPRNWPGLVALAFAVASVATFMAVLSISGPFPKSIAYGDSLLFEAYIQSPTISLVAGCLAIAVVVIALQHAFSVLWTAIVSAIVGVGLFTAVMVATAQMAGLLSPPSLDSEPIAVAGFPTIALSPPVMGMATLVIVVAAVLVIRRGISGYGPAFAALIMGGATTFYWLLNFVWGLNAG